MGKKIFFIVAGAIALVVFALIIINYRLSLEGPEIKVTTDKNEYNIGNTLKVKIENNSEKKICFSGCYPYYLEKKEENWRSYQYSACSGANLVENCIDSKGVKAYELILPSVEEGLHRLAVPACIGCSSEELFEEDQWFYSNEFTIK